MLLVRARRTLNANPSPPKARETLPNKSFERTRWRAPRNFAVRQISPTQHDSPPQLRHVLHTPGHLTRDGMFLELHRGPMGGSSVVAEAFYSDATGNLTTSIFQRDVPDEILEEFFAEARNWLPPIASAAEDHG